METNLKRLLQPAIVLRVDGFVSCVFGLATGFFQAAIFSTAVDLKGAGATGDGDSLVESALLTLSGYYVLVGSILTLLARLPAPYAQRLCVAVAAHHAFMACKDVVDADRPWRTGSPWWDVGIHVAFVAAYVLSLWLTRGVDERASK